MFFTLKDTATEAGKAISADNAKKIQDIHDSTMDLGAGCSYAGIGIGGLYESARMLEAALPMNTSHDALRGQLRDALRTAHNVSGWSDAGPWVNDVFPGNVVYQHQGQQYKRSYSVGSGAAGSTPAVTLGSAKKVHTAYVDSKDDTQESQRLLIDIPANATERDIPDSVRKKDNPDDFAGKGTSFPILKAEDVNAALRSIGRAGSDNLDSATLKANILRIAKKKGFPVPASDKVANSDVMITLPLGAEVVRESINFCGEAQIREGAAKLGAIPVKIIGPGWGSSAYYSADVIKQAIKDKVWHAGQHMYFNHATATEEAERPEGSINNLAAVMKEDAHWDDNGPKGPGAYTTAKVFSDHADQISEKGPYIGASVNVALQYRAGEAEGRQGRIAEKFIKTNANSTDFVTKAGAGGAPIVPVQEAQRAADPQSTNKENEMDDKAAEALRTENEELKAKNKKMQRQEDQTVATATIGMVLREAGVKFSPSILSRACANPEMKDGKPEKDWMNAIISEFTESAGLTGKVEGMGSQQTQEADATKDAAKMKEAMKALGVPEAGLEYAVQGRV